MVLKYKQGRTIMEKEMTCQYNNEDKSLMKIAAEAKNKSRLQELIDFAKISGFKKLGIANCKSVDSLAQKMADLLRDAGFEVVSINCKESGLDGAEICESMVGPCCDPISQAKFLNDAKTDFNINVGLCLGHGLLFQKYSKAEVTTFLVKDAVSGHKTVESLTA